MRRAEFRALTLQQTGAAPAQPALTGSIALTASYATNAGQVHTPVVGAVYATPALTFDFAAPHEPSAKWRFSAEFVADSDFYDHDPADFDESRLGGFVAVDHDSTAGGLHFALKPQVTFGSAYNHYAYTRLGFVAGFKPAFAQSIALNAETEYRIADSDGQRRWLVTLSAKTSLIKPDDRKGTTLSVTLGQTFRYSAFRAGPNDGRRDLLSKTSLSLDPGLFPASSHASLSLDASLFHGFSNRSINRFTDFEIGPTFTLNF